MVSILFSDLLSLAEESSKNIDLSSVVIESMWIRITEPWLAYLFEPPPISIEGTRNTLRRFRNRDANCVTHIIQLFVGELHQQYPRAYHYRRFIAFFPFRQSFDAYVFSDPRLSYFSG